MDDLSYLSKVKDSADKYHVELSDEDLARLVTLAWHDMDYNWILHKMGTYNKTLADALVAYITYGE